MPKELRSRRFRESHRRCHRPIRMDPSGGGSEHARFARKEPKRRGCRLPVIEKLERLADAAKPGLDLLDVGRVAGPEIKKPDLVENPTACLPVQLGPERIRLGGDLGERRIVVRLAHDAGRTVRRAAPMAGRELLVNRHSVAASGEGQRGARADDARPNDRDRHLLLLRRSLRRFLVLELRPNLARGGLLFLLGTVTSLSDLFVTNSHRAKSTW